MASLSYLLFATLLASFLFWTSHGDTVGFLDVSSGSYLKPTAPRRLSAEGYAVVQSVLSHNAAPFDVSKPLAEEVDAFLVADVFHRPVATWNVKLFGATQEELFDSKTSENVQIPPVKFVEIFGTASPTAPTQLPPTNRVFQNCGVACLAENLREGTSRLGGSFHPDTSGEKMVLKLSQCSANAFPLMAGSLSIWTAELGGLWKDVLAAVSVPGVPVRYESTLTGLYLVRQQYGASSEEFSFASCFMAATLMKMHSTLEDVFHGHVLTSIMMQDTPETILADKLVEEAMVVHARNLLSVMKYADNDPTTSVEEKTKRFSTNAVGYVMFLLLLFCSLGSIYAMANMDFTKDTLLYSQAKID